MFRYFNFIIIYIFGLSEGIYNNNCKKKQEKILFKHNFL